MIDAHGGNLTNIMMNPSERLETEAQSRDWPSWCVTSRQLCDLELLLNGGLSPLNGFIGYADYQAVCGSMRLADGTLWPIPVTLDVTEEIARRLKPSSRLSLRDPEGMMLAVLHVEDIWKPSFDAEAKAVFGTVNREHPGVACLFNRTNPWYVGGRLDGIQLPIHYDFQCLRLTPRELRFEFLQRGWTRVLAYQTQNPMHRAHLEATLRAARSVGAGLLIHPPVSVQVHADMDDYARIRCYRALLSQCPSNSVALAVLPLSIRMAGAREELWHAIIRKNYGCSHFMFGRDENGSQNAFEDSQMSDDVQRLLREHKNELGIEMTPFKKMVYIKDGGKFVLEDEVPSNVDVVDISQIELRSILERGGEIPEWFTFPTLAKELKHIYPPRLERGITILLTGLSGAGKSTIANVLLAKLLEIGGRPVTLLDGDVVRAHISPELGFSKAHRDINMQRIGFIAAEIAKNGGIAICPVIAPYDYIRKEVRSIIEQKGTFLLIYVATPIEVCEQRDRKGLYAKARQGNLLYFTGISDPYEAPADAEVTIDTTLTTPQQAAQSILNYLDLQGYVNAGGHVVGAGCV